ncbi:uncharacterized protein LOC130647763 [Hydractinia symbiolongicarpus]|uniref:uncharacterized protein LOC130647763 n=1 Tax=Hydractinia symbiolongicarpus TaxID=13093 RepID=UPI00254B40C2|nr:uncharacterized protein LOC130647763 [Hydractinia symbiolongicarpus]
MAHSEEFFVLFFIFLVTVFLYQRFFKKRKLAIPGQNSIIKDNENYIRLLTCLNYAGRRAALHIMFKHGLPQDKKLLYQKLLLFQPTFLKLKGKKIIKEKEWDLLYPKSKETQYEEFDVTLICIVIQNCTSLTPPIGGWKIKTPQVKDKSIAAYLGHLRAFRNKLSHYGNTKMSNADFETFWSELLIILTGLQFQVSSIQELYNCPLDCTYEYRNAIVKSQVDLCYDKLKDCTVLKRRFSDVVSDHKNLSKRHDIMQQKVETEKSIRQSEVLKIRNQLDGIQLEKERSTYNLLEIYDRVTLLAADVGSLEERVDSQMELSKEEIEDIKKNELSLSGSLVSAPFLNGGQMGGKYCREINFSGNQNLTPDNLRELYNYLHQADAYILDELILYECNLQDFHLKVIQQIVPYIKNLNISHNTCISVSGWKSFTDALLTFGLNRLEHINFEECDINDEDLTSLCPLIARIKSAILNYNKEITPLGLKFLSQVCQQSAPLLLERLELIACDLTDDHLKSISDVIPSLNYLTLCGNSRITSEGLRCISDAISNTGSYQLESLDIRCCNFNDNDMIEIAKLFDKIDEVDCTNNTLMTNLSWKTLLETLYPNENNTIGVFNFVSPITDDNILTVSEIFVRSRQVNLYDQNLSSKHFEVLTDIILDKKDSVLEYLFFVNCNFDDTHFGCLLRLMQSNVVSFWWKNYIHVNDRTLKEGLRELLAEKRFGIQKLELPEFNLTDSHLENIVADICSMSTLDIRKNRKLTPIVFRNIGEKVFKDGSYLLESMCLSDCNIRDDHLEALKYFIPRLKSLDISNNICIKPSGIRKLSAAFFSARCSLDSLNLSACNLTDDHLQALCILVPSVRQVNLDENRSITAKGLKCLANTLSKAPNMRTDKLSFAKCSIEQDGIVALLKIGVYLSILDLSENKSLEPIKCFNFPKTKMIKLEKLDLASCNLKGSLLTEMSDTMLHLCEVDFGCNTAMSVESIRCFSNAICNGKSRLGDVSFRECNFTDNHVEAFSSAVPLIEHVSLKGNKGITDKGWSALSSEIVYAKVLKLHTLDLSNCNLMNEHIMVLKDMFKRIYRIYLSNNGLLTDKSLQHMAEVVTSVDNNQLKIIHFHDCNLTIRQIEALRPILNYVVSISFQGNNSLGKFGLRSLTKSVRSSTCKLSEIDLQNCNLQNKDLDEIKRMLPILDKVEIGGNHFITESGMLEMMDMPCRVTTINNSDNLPQERNLPGFYTYLTKAKKLNLSESRNLTSEIIELICNTITTSPINKLRLMDISKCNLTDVNIATISQLLPFIQELDISGNKQITSKGYTYLAETVKTSKICMLDSLRVANCNIVDEHLKSLSTVIKAIKSLDLSENNHITQLGWQFLTKICTETNIRLECLTLKNCDLSLNEIKALITLVPVLDSFIWSQNFTLLPSDYSFFANAFCSSDGLALRRMEFVHPNINEASIQQLADMLPLVQELTFNDIAVLPLGILEKLSKVLFSECVSLLNSLELSNCFLTDKHMDAICKMTSIFSTIDIRKNALITKEGYKKLAISLQQHSNTNSLKLDTLCLNECILGEEEIQVIAPIFPLLREVQMFDNKGITPQSLKVIADQIAENSNSRLEAVDLSYCNLSEEHLKCMGSMVPFLKKIKFQYTMFTLNQCKYLSNIIHTAKRLNTEELSFVDSDFGDPQIIALAEVVSNVKAVDLSTNRKISAEGLKFLSHYIFNRTWSNLETLTLKNCNMDEEKLGSLARIFLKLKNLVLDDNATITPEALFALFNQSKENLKNYAIPKVSLIDCNITDDHLRKISAFIPYMKELDLSTQRFISSIGLQYITVALLNTKYRKLEIVKLRDCNINASHVKAISTIIPLIKELDLSCNRTITPDVMDAICHAVTSAAKSQLEVLMLNDINLNAEHVEKMIQMVPFLRKLDLSDNRSITPSCLNRLAEATISDCLSNPEEVVLSNCSLREDHLKALCNLAPRIPTLNLSNNKFLTPIGLKLLSNTVWNAMDKLKLSSLSLASCNLKDEHLECLSLLSICIKELDLSENKRISAIGFRAFSGFIKSSELSRLEIVKFKGCGLTATHFDSMAGLIQSVKQINLDSNRNLAGGDLAHLSMAILPLPNQLEYISLEDCNLNDILLRSVCDIVPHTKEINLKQNKTISSVGLNLLKDTLHHLERYSLQTLILSHCNLQAEEFKVVGSILTRVKNIDLTGNKLITSADMSFLSNYICTSRYVKLESITLSDCNITDAHMKFIVELTPYVKRLVLNENNAITFASLEVASKKLKMVLKERGHLELQELHLKDCSLTTKWNELSFWNMYFKIFV